MIRNSVFAGVLLVSIVLVMSCGTTTQPDNITNVKYITWQKDGYLWTSENDRLVRWNIQTKRPEIIDDVSGWLLVDSENILWVFDKNQGFFGNFRGWVYM